VVISSRAAWQASRAGRRVARVTDPNGRSLLTAQRKLVATEKDIEWTAERCDAKNLYVCSGGQAHLEETELIDWRPNQSAHIAAIPRRQLRQKEPGAVATVIHRRLAGVIECGLRRLGEIGPCGRTARP